MFNGIKDLKKWYFVFFEAGLILALLILLSAFTLNLGGKKIYKPVEDEIDLSRFVEIPVTEQQEIPPAPPKPRVFTEVPDDYIFDDPIDEIPDFSLDNSSNMPFTSDQTGDKDETIFVPFEQRPKIIGGIESVYKEITYPKKAKLAGIEGTVIIQFIVNKKGNVTNAKVIRGIGGGCDEEALRAVKNIKFKPARQRERYVNIQMRIPIKFQLKS